MSLKHEIETWSQALRAHDEADFYTALRLFLTIGDNSKIMFNMGLIRAAMGEHRAAVELLRAATDADRFLAVAYHQRGVSQFLLGRYEEARRSFDDAFLYLRGNEFINYAQIGLSFKLFAAEVLFNRGLSAIYLGNTQAGLSDLERASRHRQTPEHDVLDDAIAARGERYTVFSIPAGVLYRPAASKVSNVQAKDYLPKAKLVAATDSSDSSVEFTPQVRVDLPPAVARGRPADLSRSKSMAGGVGTGNGLTRLFSRRKQSEPSLTRSRTEVSIPTSSSLQSRQVRSNTVTSFSTGTSNTRPILPPLSFQSPSNLGSSPLLPSVNAFPSTGAEAAASHRFDVGRHAQKETYIGRMETDFGKTGAVGDWEKRRVEQTRKGSGTGRTERPRVDQEEEDEERIIFAVSDREDSDRSVMDEVYGDYYASSSDNAHDDDNRISTTAIFHLPTESDNPTSPPVSPFTSPRALPQPPPHQLYPKEEPSHPSRIKNWSQTYQHKSNHPANSSSISSMPTLSSSASHSRSSTLSSIDELSHSPSQHHPRPHISHSANSSSLSDKTPATTLPLFHSSPLHKLGRSATLSRKNSLGTPRLNDGFGLLSLEEDERREEAIVGGRRCAVRVIDSRNGSMDGSFSGGGRGRELENGKAGSDVEVTRVRLMIHHASELRALTFPCSSETPTTLPSLLYRLRSKFSLPQPSSFQKQELKIEFVDEVGLKIRLADEDDFEVALDVARTNAHGRSEGRLEIWLNEDC